MQNKYICNQYYHAELYLYPWKKCTNRDGDKQFEMKDTDMGICEFYACAACEKKEEVTCCSQCSKEFIPHKLGTPGDDVYYNGLNYCSSECLIEMFENKLKNTSNLLGKIKPAQILNILCEELHTDHCEYNVLDKIIYGMEEATDRIYNLFKTGKIKKKEVNFGT